MHVGKERTEESRTEDAAVTKRAPEAQETVTQPSQTKEAYEAEIADTLEAYEADLAARDQQLEELRREKECILHRVEVYA